MKASLEKVESKLRARWSMIDFVLIVKFSHPVRYYYNNIVRIFFIPIPVDRGTRFCPRARTFYHLCAQLALMLFFPHTCLSVIIVVFIEGNFSWNILFFCFISISTFCFSLTLMVFYMYFTRKIYMIVIIKIQINVLWEMPVTASLFRAPQSFRTMDWRSRTNKSLRKGLNITNEKKFQASEHLRCIFIAFICIFIA